MRQVIDEAHRYTVTRHAQIRREHRSGSVLKTQEWPSWIDGACARPRIVGLDVLFQLQSQRRQVPGFYNQPTPEFPLNRKRPLQGVAGSLVQVDSRLLNLRRPK